METEAHGMDEPEDLNETDSAILGILLGGRETRGSLAAEDVLNKHNNYIGERMRWLRSESLVRYHHQETALYEITQKGAEWRLALDDDICEYCGAAIEGPYQRCAARDLRMCSPTAVSREY
jgi:hypothetical protein